MRFDEVKKKFDGRSFGFSVALLVFGDDTAQPVNSQVAAMAHAIKLSGISQEPFFTGISVQDGLLEQELKHCAKSCALNMLESIRVFGPESRFGSLHYHKAIVCIHAQYHQLAEQIFHKVFTLHPSLSFELLPFPVSQISTTTEEAQEEAYA